MAAAPTSVRVAVEDRVLSLSNLDKVLYPELGFTKGEVIDYYTRIAPALLPHVTERPLTRRRWPDGVGSESFFEKNAPRGKPKWVRTAAIPTPGSTKGHEIIHFVVVDDLPTLVWLANLAALELHVPQWRVDAHDEGLDPDLVVFDLDPGEPAGIEECAEVALLLRDRLAADDMSAYAKTSGAKGMQLYVPIEPDSGERTAEYAKLLATELTRERPDLILADMTRARRRGKVFIDWSQNNPAKTTVAPYSLRGRERPTVSTPLLWEEIEEFDAAEGLSFSPEDVLARVAEYGDLFAELTGDETRQPLPSA